RRYRWYRSLRETRRAAPMHRSPPHHPAASASQWRPDCLKTLIFPRVRALHVTSQREGLASLIVDWKNRPPAVFQPAGLLFRGSVTGTLNRIQELALGLRGGAPCAAPLPVGLKNEHADEAAPSRFGDRWGPHGDGSRADASDQRVRWQHK